MCTNHTDKNWSELEDGERNQIENVYSSTRRISVKIANKYNYMLYGWLVILNAGGLVGIISLLHFKNICGVKFLSLIGCAFAVGIILIIVATFLERWRFNLNANRVKNEFNKLKQGEITKCKFENEINSLNCYKCLKYIVYILEILSCLIFIFGVSVVITKTYSSTPDSCVLSTNNPPHAHTKTKK